MTEIKFLIDAWPLVTAVFGIIWWLSKLESKVAAQKEALIDVRAEFLAKIADARAESLAKIADAKESFHDKLETQARHIENHRIQLMGLDDLLGERLGEVVERLARIEGAMSIGKRTNT